MIQRSTAASTHAEPGDSPVRTCVGCRCRALNSELLRVVAVDRHLVVDERRRLAGRGAWLHPDPKCFDAALRRRAFPRALRVSGDLDADGLGGYLTDRLQRARVVSTDAGSSVSCRTEESRSTRHESAVKLKP